MKYDFDTPVSRKGTGSLKWDVKEGELPMWVADMDFKTAPAIVEALSKRVEHGIFGYTDIEESWREAYQGWWQKRHGVSFDKEGLIFCTGIVPAISSIVRKLTTPNENVVIQTPVYNIFFNSVINNGCRALESPLKYDGAEYEMDFDDLEEKLKNPQTSLMILCNPHNPVGRIWTRDELSKVADLCVKYGVTVISDEIHCDIVRPGLEYTPFCAVSDNARKCSITCIAPTKTFNIAGLQTAAVYVSDPFLRHKVWRGLNTDEVAEPNAFAALAATTAFSEGEEWLKELNEYLFENRRVFEEYVQENIPGLLLTKADATYLVWANIKKFSNSSEELAQFIREKTGLFVNEGIEYGKMGEGFLRINIACPRSRMMDGLERLKRGLELWEALK